MIVGSKPKRRKMSAHRIEGSDQLDQPGIRRKSRIVCMRAAKDQRLHDDSDGDPELRLPKRSPMIARARAVPRGTRIPP